MPAVARLIGDYNEYVDAIRERAAELGMSRLERDLQAGLASGHSGKLLGAKHVKKFGFVSLGLVLGAIGCKLILVEDSTQTAKILARREPRQEKMVRQSLAAAMPLGDAV
jgi:hypothetical protein